MTVNIRYKGDLITHPAEEGALLSAILKDAGINLSNPCGGNGVCGKCKVSVKGLGQVLACQHRIDDDAEIIVPDLPNMQILSEAYFPEWITDHGSQIKDHGCCEYALALDIGTTTCVLYLEDLLNKKNLGTTSFVNPQQTYGADIMSRIQYCRTHEHGTEELQSVFLNQLEQGIVSLCMKYDVEVSKIQQLSVVGNTTMLHIFSGINPEPLAEVPFAPVFTALTRRSDLFKNDLLCHLDVVLLPSLSAYIGADIVAGLAAIDWPEDGRSLLYMDIGTNGEMAMISADRIVTCATAAGPAFEGASIHCGTGGVEGAIHQFSDKGFSTIANQPPLGLCGSGLVDSIAHMLDHEIIEKSGFMEKNYTLVDENQHGQHPEIVITPQDVREVQLAKGAIAAGIKVMKDRFFTSHSSLNPEFIQGITHLFLAGGFGTTLNSQSATRIGLIPEDLSERVIRAGNVAGLGARLYLHEPVFISRINRVLEISEYIDLSMDMDFNELFVTHMTF